jgi:thiol:disulfide interchange protein DsbA
MTKPDDPVSCADVTLQMDRETGRMRSILSKFLVIGLLLGTPLAHAQQQQEWDEGKHYSEIKPAQRPPDAQQGVVEVTEVFSYGCIYCNRALPLMDKIRKSLPSNAHMGYLPASFNAAESWPMFQRVYYTAVALGLMPKMHETLFSGVWSSNELAVVEADGRKLKSPQPTIEDAAKFVAKKAGIKPEQFLATAKSFSVDANCRRADQIVKAYKIQGTPSLVVNGRYLVNMSSVKSESELIELVNWLVAKEAH